MLHNQENSVPQDTPAHQRPDGVLGEWNTISEDDWNVHQRIAEKTHGVVTLANFVSLAGAALTASGLRDWHKGDEEKALIKVGAGRVLDVVDGIVAKRTGTRGKVGAGVDAGADKVLTGMAAFQLAKDSTISKPYAVATLFQQARNTVENARIEKMGGEPNPSHDGKYGMGVFWASLGSHIIERVAYKHGAEKVAQSAGIIAAGAEVISLGLNQKAGSGYAKQRKCLSQKIN